MLQLTILYNNSTFFNPSYNGERLTCYKILSTPTVSYALKLVTIIIQCKLTESKCLHQKFLTQCLTIQDLVQNCYWNVQAITRKCHVSCFAKNDDLESVCVLSLSQRYFTKIYKN